MWGLYYSAFFSHGFKGTFYNNVCAIYTYFWGKITLKKLFLRNSGKWKIFLDWYLRYYNDMHKYCFGPNNFKTAEIVGAHT